MVVVALTLTLFKCHHYYDSEHGYDDHTEDCSLKKLRTPYCDKCRYNSDEDEAGKSQSDYFLFFHMVVYLGAIY